MREEFEDTEHWHKRGYLPHYDISNKYQMITYRLADALPQKVLYELAGRADWQSASKAEQTQKRKLLEKYLDQGYGSCLLEKYGYIIIDNWKFFNRIRYELIAYVVMPNHAHILIKTYPEWSLGQIIKTWKSYSAKEIRKLVQQENADYQSALPAHPNSHDILDQKRNADYQCLHPATHTILSSGQAFWQREYWDRFIRNENHFKNAIEYIHQNPIKAGLCKHAEDWKWTGFKD